MFNNIVFAYYLKDGELATFSSGLTIIRRRKSTPESTTFKNLITHLTPSVLYLSAIKGYGLEGSGISVYKGWDGVKLPVYNQERPVVLSDPNSIVGTCLDIANIRGEYFSTDCSLVESHSKSYTNELNKLSEPVSILDQEAVCTNIDKIIPGEPVSDALTVSDPDNISANLSNTIPAIDTSIAGDLSDAVSVPPQADASPEASLDIVATEPTTISEGSSPEVSSRVIPEESTSVDTEGTSSVHTDLGEGDYPNVEMGEGDSTAENPDVQTEDSTLEDSVCTNPILPDLGEGEGDTSVENPDQQTAKPEDSSSEESEGTLPVLPDLGEGEGEGVDTSVENPDVQTTKPEDSSLEEAEGTHPVLPDLGEGETSIPSLTRSDLDAIMSPDPLKEGVSLKLAELEEIKNWGQTPNIKPLGEDSSLEIKIEQSTASLQQSRGEGGGWSPG